MSKGALWRNFWLPAPPVAPAALPRWKVPITISDDFLTVRPSLDELFDQIVQNYSGFRRKSGVFRSIGATNGERQRAVFGLPALRSPAGTSPVS